MEVEAKFVVPNGKVFRRLERCRELAGYTITPTATVTVTDRYFDTPDGRLMAGGYACRLRTEGEAVIATLKGLGGAGGAIHRRDEREVRLAEWTPDAAAWPESPARSLALELSAGAPLAELFQLVQRRARAQVCQGDRSVAELSLDDVQLDLPGASDRYYEIEIELKDAGTEDDLSVLAGELAAGWQLAPEGRSKFQRAFETFRSHDLPLQTRLSAEERAALERHAAESGTRQAARAGIVLGWADGLSTREIAARTGLSRVSVRNWVRAFREQRLAALDGRQPPAADDGSVVADGSAPAAEVAPKAAEPAEPAQPAAPAEKDKDKAGGLPEVPAIRADEPMSEAGRKLMFVHFSRMVYHEPGTRAGEDPEALHDMRVATRRLRAAFQLFTPYFDADALTPFNKRLRRTGRALGAVRDLDVLLGKARDYAGQLPDGQRDALGPLLEAWQGHREAARKELLAYLDTGGYRKFKEGFETFLTTPGAGAPAVQPTEPVAYQVRHVVARLLFTRYEAVRAYEGIMTDAPLATYHRLRIDCKRFRYAMEFFRDVLGPEAPPLIKQVVAVQDLLGDLHDATVAEALVAEHLNREIATHATQTHPAPLDGVLSYLTAQWTVQRDLLSRFPALWAGLVGADFRRSLGMAVAAL